MSWPLARTARGEEVRSFVPAPLPPSAPLDLLGRGGDWEAWLGCPVASLQDVGARSDVSFPAASAGMAVLGRLRIVRGLTGKRRSRLFVYERYIGILGEGTEAS